MMNLVGIGWATFFGFFLGFAFGVGCALAVMYGIYLGGYRAALRDASQATAPRRLLQERTRLERRAQRGGS
jgi:hypothetical protein